MFDNTPVPLSRTGVEHLIFVLYFWFSMELIKDILVNLLSDAIWAIGGFAAARLLLLKKSTLFLTSEQNVKKKHILNHYQGRRKQDATIFTT